MDGLSEETYTMLHNSTIDADLNQTQLAGLEDTSTNTDELLDLPENSLCREEHKC